MKCLVTVFLLLTSLLSEVASTKHIFTLYTCQGNRGDFNSLLQTDADKGNKVQLYSAVNEGRVRIMNNESGKKNVNVEDTTDVSLYIGQNRFYVQDVLNMLFILIIIGIQIVEVFVPLQPRSIPVKPVPTPAEVDPPAPTPEVKPRSGAKCIGSIHSVRMVPSVEEGNKCNKST
eukprot:scaffold249361_cov77-Cyclotella_meneghiniana.AAC.4